MNDERFDIDVGYRDPDDLPRDDFPEDRPSPAEYEDDLVERVANVLARARMAEPGDTEPFGYWTAGYDRDLARAVIAEMEDGQ